MNELSTAPNPSTPISLLAGMDIATVDTDKLEKLLDLQAKWEDRQAEKDLAEALAKFQSVSPPIRKSRESNTGLYASLDDILVAIRSAMAENGLSVSFDTLSAAAGELTVTCHVLHSKGGRFFRTVTVPVDKAMRANDTQKMGSAISYAKRYALIAALNLIVSDHDDDGAAGGTSFITEDQAGEIHNLLEQIGKPLVRQKFLAWAKAETVEQIASDIFPVAIKRLQASLNQ